MASRCVLVVLPGGRRPLVVRFVARPVVRRVECLQRPVRFGQGHDDRRVVNAVEFLPPRLRQNLLGLFFLRVGWEDARPRRVVAGPRNVLRMIRIHEGLNRRPLQRARPLGHGAELRRTASLRAFGPRRRHAAVDLVDGVILAGTRVDAIGGEHHLVRQRRLGGELESVRAVHLLWTHRKGVGQPVRLVGAGPGVFPRRQVVVDVHAGLPQFPRHLRHVESRGLWRPVHDIRQRLVLTRPGGVSAIAGVAHHDVRRARILGLRLLARPKPHRGDGGHALVHDLEHRLDGAAGALRHLSAKCRVPSLRVRARARVLLDRRGSVHRRAGRRRAHTS
mmetsp:Transcript_85245/g.260601  ORF Transcript_85245/g.260601 Transcript_85245/m.260601 type:complete len:334 (-) Transcript_85245:232-1233(-)